MKLSSRARQAITEYVSGGQDIYKLESWALEFGDTVDERNDDESLLVAGQILEWLRELDDGVRLRSEFDESLRDMILTSAAAD